VNGVVSVDFCVFAARSASATLSRLEGDGATALQNVRWSIPSRAYVGAGFALPGGIRVLAGVRVKGAAQARVEELAEAV
jgi:hypothetical protein